MKKMMTAEEAFNVAMNEYPSLYSADTIEEARRKYFDHIFNVIGNGYRSIEEFVAGHTINKKNVELTKGFDEKYISGEPLFYAYKEIDNRHGIEMGKHGSELPGVYTRKELDAMPEVKYSMQSNEKYEFYDYTWNPYPNFEKKYSIVWEDISVLDKSWVEAAIVFYSQCRDFFNSEDAHKYHYAVPKEEQALDKAIKDFETAFARCKKEGMTDTQWHAAISEAYEHPYTGDTKEFITTKWNKELVRINEFLDETLDRLEGLKNQNKKKVKP